MTTSSFQPDLRQLHTIITPPVSALGDVPQAVRDALEAQEQAVDALLTHADEAEAVLADDWADRVEREMLALAAEGKDDYIDLMDRRRVERVEAITKYRQLEPAVRLAARTARAAVQEWLSSPDALDGILDAEADARADELDALHGFFEARAAWLRRAGLLQWHVAAATATARTIPDYSGRPLVDGRSVESSQVHKVEEYVADEHRRAGVGVEVTRRSAMTTIIGPNGIKQTVPLATGRTLVAAERAEFADTPTAG